MTLTPIQNYVKFQAFAQDDDFILEAIAVLEAQGDIDLEIVEGAARGRYKLCQDVAKGVSDFLDIIPEIVKPYINWDNLIIDWLSCEDAVAVKISLGIVIIWRSDLGNNIQTRQFLERLKQ